MTMQSLWIFGLVLAMFGFSLLLGPRLKQVIPIKKGRRVLR